jgi:hypothetical protein
LLLMSKNSYFLIVTDYRVTGRSPRQNFVNHVFTAYLSKFVKKYIYEVYIY